MKEKIIGIDLGTTNSCVSIIENGQPKVIPNLEGGRTTPSVITIKSESEFLVGISAKRNAVANPDSTIIASKRFIGRPFTSSQKDITNHPTTYKIVSGKNNGTGIDVKGKIYTPEEVASKILVKLKEAAESYLGETVKKAVITVPAYFDDSQRQATKNAGEIAGLEVVRIINEPTAAALAYGLDKSTNETFVVYDLGGGTFDVSILELSDGVFEVISTNGDAFLGGEDVDNQIVEYLEKEFKSQAGFAIGAKDIAAKQRLKEAAEKAKIELSSLSTAEISLPYLTVDVNGPHHLQVTLSRAKLDEMMHDIVKKTEVCCHKALESAKMKPESISKVILVGGQTRSPYVQSEIKKIFPNAVIEKGVDPDEAVAIGAAIQGAVLAGDIKGVVLLDVTPLSLGIETLGGVFTKVIDANTTIPTTKSQVFSTAADNQTSVSIVIGQGERSMMADNKRLGEFNLDGIPAAPKGVPQIEVTFSLDANGILNVSAKEKGTGKEQTITIKESSGLSKEDIEKMKKDAEIHAEEDKKRLELIETRNRAESLMIDAERTLKDNKEKISEEKKVSLEEKIKQVRENYITETEKEKIETMINDLQSELMTLQQELNSQNSQEEPQNTENA